MYSSLGKIYPERLRRRYKKLLVYSDIAMKPEDFVGAVMFFSFVVSAIISGIAYFFYNLLIAQTAAVFLIFFFFFQILGYIFLVMRADSKAKFVEEVLPDALLLMSMNIKSGMTTDRALITAARPEFGPLERELGKAGKDIFTGSTTKVALLGMTERINSPLFDRTIRLIIEGIETGGELSTLLQQTAQDIQNTKLVNNEVRSSVLMYIIFIFFATGFGAPLLFGISTYLVGTISAQFALFQANGLSQDVAISLHVGPNFLVEFAVISLAITSFFGGLIMGVVKSGDEKAGLKYIPMLLVSSFVIFFAVRALVATIFPALT